MPQSDFEYQYSPGKRRDVRYTIGVRLDPSANNVESFAAILFFQLSDGTRVQVIKVDDSPHNGKQDIHADRYYRGPSADLKDFDVQFEGWVDAEDYVERNWKDFVDTYHDNYGTEPRDDKKNI